MQPHQALKNLLFGSPIEANLILKKPNAPRSKGKGFLSLFEVIKFPNTKCSVSIGVGGSLTGLFQIFTSRQGKKDTNTKDTMTKSITRRIAIAIVAVRSIRGLYA